MRTILNTLVLACFVWGAVPALAGDKDVTLYKNPQCGCCEGYADYLRENGFTVTTKPTHDLAEMSRQAGIPDEFQGCHLSFIDGYVVSGHVPIGTVEKLLTERPDIKGVTLPGMPMGSPGMSGAKEAPFEMLEITESGAIGGVYARE
ncbi:MAG: DUF411 domain-containing protein [Parvibaculum sp.]|jgi:hypothetical protein|uniref:DUF411 domain-containing protein n=1 Tax=Neoaquamicrobium microcysteis TaxID=2682781 RepID=A0A5D4GZK6_9HYPH|nr:DUF411 domain-containing protein [Mesorhizobium microcysteis]TYR33453.1 DUF411 domain-containing protein [Mesorhizobium microcysteis]HWK33265.1 DUF411 domain-containing protein [Hyphomicrobium sp.]